MLKNEARLGSDHRKFIKLTVLLALMTILGCGGGEGGSPMTSNLSTPKNSIADSTSGQSWDSVKTSQAEQAEPTTLLATDSQPDGALDPLGSMEEDPLFLPSSFPEDELEPTPSPTTPRVSLRINWDHAPDSDVTSYYVYYGKQPSTELGSCAYYEESQSVTTPPATISGLEPNTPYFFAISAFKESESSCSTEIMLVTPPISPEEL